LGHKFCQVYIILVKYKAKNYLKKKKKKRRSYKIVNLHYFLFLLLNIIIFSNLNGCHIQALFSKLFQGVKGSPGPVPLFVPSICTYKCESIVENPLEMLINCGGNPVTYWNRAC
jgi:hypothetical protein